MKVGVVVFPGSNCDRDCLEATSRVMGWDSVACWHRNALPGDLDLVILPGGFSYGDYLRAGALASMSLILKDVRGFAQKGGLVLGICNGFQVLCESRILPGALRINRGLVFRCEDIHLQVARHETPFTQSCPKQMALPIAHRDGNYYADPDTLARLEEERCVLFRYVDSEGNPTDAANPNGSANNIAGICNERGNVCGLMPHPERSCERLLGPSDGRFIFESIAHAQER